MRYERRGGITKEDDWQEYRWPIKKEHIAGHTRATAASLTVESDFWTPQRNPERVQQVRLNVKI